MLSLFIKIDRKCSVQCIVRLSLFLRHFLFITVHHAWNTCGIDWHSEWKWKIKIENFSNDANSTPKAITPKMSEICAFVSVLTYFCVHNKGYEAMLYAIGKWKIIQRNNPLISVLKCSIHLLSVNGKLVMSFKLQFFSKSWIKQGTCHQW